MDAGETDEADEDAVQELAKAMAEGELNAEIDLDEPGRNIEVRRGQMRFFRKTGLKMAGLKDVEINGVLEAVKETVRKTGGNPALITASPQTFGFGKAPFVLIGNIPIEHVHKIFGHYTDLSGGSEV
ncbi:hypothetical protein CYMTET_27657 [Cymbomonas tetramitiformis]|uniref:Uncharacterized protein n=1 Tax=Cymbomonas tetramitiformis TaxID=36881 RepID=A0AAE0FPI6_9CHLO|nr:hypothetical protein CYMTET_27657 [Cymbomonas tetramitiformis]